MTTIQSSLESTMRASRSVDEISELLSLQIPGYQPAELNHALEFLKYIHREEDVLSLDIMLDDQLLEYLDDLLAYSLTRCLIDNGEETGFKLWQNYRMDQVQLKLLKNPGYTAVGTYYYDDVVVIFASLKKDLDEENRLNYKDKFLQPDLFQWESKANLSAGDLSKLNRCRFAYVFIRKVSDENGITLPFTFVGKGILGNCRATNNGNGTFLFDIQMENMLPDYLQYDFGLSRE